MLLLCQLLAACFRVAHASTGLPSLVYPVSHCEVQTGVQLLHPRKTAVANSMAQRAQESVAGPAVVLVLTYALSVLSALVPDKYSLSQVKLSSTAEDGYPRLVCHVQQAGAHLMQIARAALLARGQAAMTTVSL